MFAITSTANGNQLNTDAEQKLKVSNIIGETVATRH